MSDSYMTPPHRRPAEQKDQAAWKWNVQMRPIRSKLEANMTAKQFEKDTFCYDPDRLAYWEIPAALYEALPEWLLEVLNEALCAGAAVGTTLDRIHQLDDTAMMRGWPVVMSGTLGAKSPSDSNPPAIIYTPTPPSSTTSPHGSFSHSQDSTICTSRRSLRRFTNDLPKLAITGSSASSSALETPPFTPEDVKAINIPTTIPEDIRAVDPLDLNNRLQGVQKEQRRVPWSPGKFQPIKTGDRFDPIAWERFLEQYRRELHGITKDDLVRFDHQCRAVLGKIFEYRGNPRYPWAPGIQRKFEIWWVDIEEKKEFVHKYIDLIELPNLEVVVEKRCAYLNLPLPPKVHNPETGYEE